MRAHLAFPNRFTLANLFNTKKVKIISLKFLIVDLFCGAGGTTIGFEHSKVAKVIAAVNHDPKAIESHWKNHPEVHHFEEDIRTLDLTALIALVAEQRQAHPDAMLILWASLECTNFSKAKGGQPRDADSRTLAEHLHRYITAIDPEFLQIENVVEFMSWGPLDENNKPVSVKQGCDWVRWCGDVRQHGYYDSWKQMNAADYGARTSRNRLFGCFAKHGLPIHWPEATHAKKTSSVGKTGALHPWLPCRPCLDLEDVGTSIFTPGKLKSDKTFQRIYAGLIKYVAGMSTKEFIVKWHGHNNNNFNGAVADVNQPSPTVTTMNHLGLAQAEFIVSSNGGNPQGKARSSNEPIQTITTCDNKQLVVSEFIVQRNGGKAASKLVDVNGPARTLTATGGNQDLVMLNSYYGNSNTLQTADDAAPTLTTKDRIAIVQPQWLDKQYSGPENHGSIENPAGTIMSTNKIALATTQWLYNPQHGGHHQSVDAPCPTIIARQDKAPLYEMKAEAGHGEVKVLDTDSDTVRAIKAFMVMYGIVDIKMRMLRVKELMAIQGFPSDYQLLGNQADQKKFIGNSVCPVVVEKWAQAMADAVTKWRMSA